jgi:2,4-didehydro-3-deoxy-L-rhamnonate hydrolase
MRLASIRAAVPVRHEAGVERAGNERVAVERAGDERVAVERPDGRLVPCHELLPAGPGTMADLLAADSDLLGQLRRRAEAPGGLDAPGLEFLDPAAVEWLAPLPRPGKVIAVGRNYREHVTEGGSRVPDTPILFAKFSTSVIGPGADIVWDPELASAVDLEAELAVVIGRRARGVSPEEALGFVLGYTCLNDVTARDLQAADKQWVRSKSLDTFCPMGPVLVTADEIPDPGDLRIRSFLNGAPMQDSTTRELIFDVPHLISFCSRAFTLEPGDVIATGTPAGVGIYRDPPVLLKDGDEVVVEVERIGRLVNRCREERAAG